MKAVSRKVLTRNILDKSIFLRIVSDARDSLRRRG